MSTYDELERAYQALKADNQHLRELLKQFYHNLLVSYPNRMERELLEKACAALEGKE
jgi:hypothetical protein